MLLLKEFYYIRKFFTKILIWYFFTPLFINLCFSFFFYMNSKTYKIYITITTWCGINGEFLLPHLNTHEEISE